MERKIMKASKKSKARPFTFIDLFSGFALRLEVIRGKNIKKNYRTFLSEQEQKDISKTPKRWLFIFVN